MKLLLVEDDVAIVENLTDFLQTEGFQLCSANGQQAALKLAEEEEFDLAILDISLAEGNGYALCTALKHKGNMPVIFLTASGDEYSVVAGLDMGADDYISKPFRPREFVSRIRSVLRRSGKVQSIFKVGDLQIDSLKGTVYKAGTEIFLSALEYRLLLVFFHNKGIVLTRTKLLEEIWDIAGEFVNDNTLTVYIKRLRDKIEMEPQNPQIIKTIRGIGYKVGE